jgi:hypothetical protein
MKCSRIAHGFGCGSTSGFVAETKVALGFRARAVFPALKPRTLEGLAGYIEGFAKRSGINVQAEIVNR